MADQFLSIRKGDCDIFEETITNLSSLSGYTGKMYVYDDAGDAIATITGTISGLVVSYELTNEVSKALEAGTYSFETKLFDSSDHVYTPSAGIFEVRETNEEDPS